MWLDLSTIELKGCFLTFLMYYSSPGSLVYVLCVFLWRCWLGALGYMTSAMGYFSPPAFHCFPHRDASQASSYTPHTLYIECSDSQYRASGPVQLPCQCSLCPQTYAPSIRYRPPETLEEIPVYKKLLEPSAELSSEAFGQKNVSATTSSSSETRRDLSAY
jgi:hypothetical protein